MTAAPGTDFVNELLASPVGVATLAAAEASVRDDAAWLDAPVDSDPGAVQRAAESVAAMAPGEVLQLVLDAAWRFAGPWTVGAAASLAVAYELAGARRMIAETIADELSGLLHSPGAPALQEWWHSNRRFDPPFDRKFVDFSRVYGNGEFPWDGLWTVTAPPAEIHDDLIDAWELFPGPISRWRLPVRDDARIWTIDCPQDWVDLVERHPRDAPGPHSGWELPGPNQHVGNIERLLATPGQHAARAAVAGHVVPDWDRVRRDYDGVHLTWAGFITTEGRVVELDDGSVTMLRYWASERTLWLDDVFGEPEPLSSPDLSGRVNGDLGVSAHDDASRQRRDLNVLTSLLGREQHSVAPKVRATVPSPEPGVPRHDFACGYEVDVAAGDDRSAEEWARAAWEDAPVLLRWLMLAGWRFVLGLRLGPRSAPDHILGWRITECRDDVVVCHLRSGFLSAYNTFRRADERLVWSTFVVYERRIGRLIWPPVSLLHRPLVRVALRRAAAQRDT